SRHQLSVCDDPFFFQAEDGIRDRNVTGVQTCALPIYCTVFSATYVCFGPTAQLYVALNTVQLRLHHILTNKQHDALLSFHLIMLLYSYACVILLYLVTDDFDLPITVSASHNLHLY